MPKLIGFIGKGGTGKSTLTGLFLKYILEKNISPVLVIDSDPNSCLAELLGLKVDSTIGSIRRELMDKRNQANDASISKYEYCEYALSNSIIESRGFDLVVMGRPDGPGCYCMINNVVQMMIEKLKRNYRLVIVDCEAGLEHISRKTLGSIDVAFIVSDLSRKGILTAGRQTELIRELDLKTERNYLVVNNIIEDERVKDFESIINEVCNDDLGYAGIIHNDFNIADFERRGESILGLPCGSVSYADLAAMMKKIGPDFSN